MHVKTMYVNAIKGKAIYPAHYQIVATYVYMRLKNVFDEYHIDSTTTDEVCELIYRHYSEENYSIDQIINAIVNFTNCYDKFPEKSLLNKDIDVLLEDFLETYYELKNAEKEI